MKIHGQGSVNGTQFINAYKKAEKITRKNESMGDSIELSDRAKEIAELQKLAAETPEVRESLVLKIKQKVATNTYYVPAEKLAEKLYEEIVKGGK
jgi:negative regulator of flagellin synthesis FlgM